MDDQHDNALVIYPTLARAIAARMVEWDGQSDQDLGDSFYGNELAGEMGETLEMAFEVIRTAVAAGRVSNIVKKLDRERLGLAGSRATVEQLAEELADAEICLRRLALRFGVDLDRSAAQKFNATSEKVGLKTRVKVGDE